MVVPSPSSPRRRPLAPPPPVSVPTTTAAAGSGGGGAAPRRGWARRRVEARAVSEGGDAPGVDTEVALPLTPGAAKSGEAKGGAGGGGGGGGGGGAMREVLPLPVARGLLLLVPIMWATYNPALRFIYESSAPPTPAELTSVRMIISLVPFAPVLYTIGRDAGQHLGLAGQGCAGAAGGGDGGGGGGGGWGVLVGRRDWKQIRRLVRAGAELGQGPVTHARRVIRSTAFSTPASCVELNVRRGERGSFLAWRGNLNAAWRIWFRWRHLSAT